MRRRLLANKIGEIMKTIIIPAWPQSDYQDPANYINTFEGFSDIMDLVNNNVWAASENAYTGIQLDRATRLMYEDLTVKYPNGDIIHPLAVCGPGTKNTPIRALCYVFEDGSIMDANMNYIENKSNLTGPYA